MNRITFLARAAFRFALNPATPSCLYNSNSQSAVTPYRVSAFFFTRYGSLNSLSCSCVSIMLPGRIVNANACFRLLELWSSDYYSQCRNEGWYELEARTSPIEMNSLYKTNHILSNQIWAVAHFLDHLRSLYAHKVLDRRLASVLFKDSVASWIDVFGEHKVIWGNAQGFFDRRIKPLRNQL